MIIERWKNAQAYVIGKYHISNNLPCQDRTYYYEEHGVKVIALADGAGSQPHSEIGAELVCKEICELLTRNFIEYLLYFEYEKDNPAKHLLKMKELNKIIVDHIVSKLKEKAILMNVPLKELSSIAWYNMYVDRRMERTPLLKTELKNIMEKYLQAIL